MAGQHGDTACIVTDQILQASPNLNCCVPVVGKCQNTVRILASCAHQIGDAMHQHAGLARSGASQYQYIGLFAVVGDDTLLARVVERFDNRSP